MLMWIGVVAGVVMAWNVLTSAEGGSIVGCASDVGGQKLPGTTVTAKGAGVQRTGVTTGNGCYELKQLPPGSYRVSARLAGFDNVTRDRLVVAPSTEARFDLTMSMSSICECVLVGGTLADHQNRADAVLYVRLADTEQVASTLPGYYRHAATVLRTVKSPSSAPPKSVFVFQNQRSGTLDPYDVGQELVAFLESAGPGGFAIANDVLGSAVPIGSSDPAIVFLVQDGRIQRAPPQFPGYVGKSVDSFLQELRVLSRGK